MFMVWMHDFTLLSFGDRSCFMLMSQFQQITRYSREGEIRVILVKKLFSLNSSIMDDNYDTYKNTYKTANIEIIH
jgi:hypothetical protein